MTLVEQLLDEMMAEEASASGNNDRHVGVD
jgi:hypothetical protein